MISYHTHSESALEEQTIRLFESLGWESYHTQNEFETAGGSPLGRENMGEVVLTARLRPAMERLNPNHPPEAFDRAIEELLRDRSAMSLAAANREVYSLLKNGIKVPVGDPVDGGERIETVKVMDWDDPSSNDFLLCSQLWVVGEMYKRRADLVGFVNGIPLVFVELKASHKQMKDAYTGNFTDYKDTIPHLFRYNGLVILSNGSESRAGTITASWGHFVTWPKISDEEEPGVISLETMIRGTCEPARLLDLVENYSLFMEVGSREDEKGLIKILAKNHQYLGVRNAMEALSNLRDRKGRLGVFWHTQGSGKSLSMIFFAQKVLRKVPGNWTFVIVTDRIELDKQIYNNFANVGAVTEGEAHAESSAHLRQLLREDHRYVFTLIHKFRTEPGQAHPVLSERDDIIVITDEAHRSQYDTLALNMRTALPNASFLAFTGTPLIVGEEKTREVFGEYISVYNFRQSVEEKATVPLYYENRIPELQLTNAELNDDMARLLEDAELDEDQEKKLEREFARQYHLITREDRLEAVAEDIVRHFTARGFRGKGMVVCIDKATTVRMYDKVRSHWERELAVLREQVKVSMEDYKPALEEKIQYMEATDMAVVVSQGQNEIREMKEKGLDIAPHRKRMVEEDLEKKFKDENDPFRLVFVCAMWMVGFDVPSCSTIYLDKPMRNHTLMQTIARANRVFKEKKNGLIVDYVGVFRDLKKALAIYGTGPDGRAREGDMPVKDKSALVEELRSAADAVLTFCTDREIDLRSLQGVDTFHFIAERDKIADRILETEESKKEYLSLAGNVHTLFKAVAPDPVLKEMGPVCSLIYNVEMKIRSLTPQADISDVMQDVENLLDRSIHPDEGYLIRTPIEPWGGDHMVDLSKVDFEALKAKLRTGQKHIEAEKLKGQVNAKLNKMVRENRTRMDFYEQFLRMIEDYNTGRNIDHYLEELIKFIEKLNREEKRAVAEELTEEELTVFDLLTRPDMMLTREEEKQVKRTARDLLKTLKTEKLVLDWRKHQQSRAQVRVAIETVLDEGLPRTYTPEIYEQKCEAIYQHVYESYYSGEKSVYG